MHISVRSSSRSERASSGRDQMQTGHAADIAERPSLTLCKNSRRYNRTRNFGPYGHAESKKTQKFVFRSALRPNQISFSHGQDPLLRRRSSLLALRYSYSIGSSALSRIDVGTSRPSALAVVILSTVSYFTDNYTGRSAGFSLLRMRST